MFENRCPASRRHSCGKWCPVDRMGLSLIQSGWFVYSATVNLVHSVYIVSFTVRNRLMLIKLFVGVGEIDELVMLMALLFADSDESGY